MTIEETTNAIDKHPLGVESMASTTSVLSEWVGDDLVKVIDWLISEKAYTKHPRSVRQIMQGVGITYSRTKLNRELLDLVSRGVIRSIEREGQGGIKRYFFVDGTRQDVVKGIVLIELDKLRELCINEGLPQPRMVWDDDT